MRLDSDDVLIGTGVAPLVAAQQFLRQGKSAFVLNPERDFFSENSELPFDPLYPIRSENLSPQKLQQARPEDMLTTLQPEYPGAIQSWPAATGFQDVHAPFLRSRSRIWVRGSNQREWDALESMYLRAHDEGLKPQILEGIPAWSRFPGASTRKGIAMEKTRAIQLPRFADLDVSRFRTGLREFVKERIGNHRLVTGCSPIEIIEEGIRFRDEGQPRTIRVHDGILIYWTPELTHWLENLSAQFEIKPALPEGIRTWEEWDLVSKDPIEPDVIGSYEDLIVWGGTEGAPDPAKPLHALKVLRAGPIVPLSATRGGMNASFHSQLASEESFRSLARLCEDFLKWERFTVRSMQYRLLFEWGNQASSFILHRGAFETRVFSRADGAISGVVRTAKQSSERFLQEIEPRNS